MIVLLTEERSLKVTVDHLIRRHYPRLVEGSDWFVLPFSGKSDLENNILVKMRCWNYGDPVFVILRDADGGDCVALKQRLRKLAKPAKKPFKIRIVCQELESWFLGDAAAVKQAYPRSSFSNEQERYRNPDRLTNASEELAKLTGDSTKVRRALTIATHLVPSRNCSHSFQMFGRTLQQLLG